MTYLDELGTEIERLVPRDLIPEADTSALFRLYALLVLAKGRAVNSSDVHNAWAVWMQERNPDHHALRPFDELDADTKASDEPFVRAIRAVADGHSTSSRRRW